MSSSNLLKKSILVGFAVLVISVGISLLVGEYIVKHIFPQPTLRLASMEGLHALAEGKDIPFTLQKNLKNNVHMGYTHEFSHMVNTNSWGTRGEEFTANKDADTYRILFLGDSMTFGWGVEDNQTYPYLIQQSLNEFLQGKKIETINAGMASGRTLDSMFVYLKEDGLKFKPDMVILDFFPWNDLTDLADMKWEKTDSNGYPTKIISNKETVQNGTFKNRVKTNWMYEIPIFRNSHLGMLLMNALERSSPKIVDKIKAFVGVRESKPLYRQEDVTACIYSMLPSKCPGDFLALWDKSQFLIKGMAKVSQDNNIKFVVTIMPAPDQAIPLSQNPEKDKILTSQQPQKAIREFLDKEKIAYIDLLPSLTGANAKELFYSRDGHPNANGTGQIARTLSWDLASTFFPTLIKEKYKPAK